ncbi:Sugar phosphatase YidA [bioreactor metagenome]|uniref:Sugar phosphatase YidA n=1 Tax=bioreactor metagenome TaxID=1076179 RepID=A0A645DHB9_9ZZZZ|nr:Cof-type HAD-IIB family hydrolase [Anaerorhabdus sp.]MEA4875263.1 Cof-type HAD-IIB family hydrolase [Anaerorhabdus sp.]
MIKLVATDLDGTLLNENRELSEVNKKTIKKMIDSNIILCFATGRPLNGIKHFLEECNLTNTESYSITNTGACIYRNQNFQLLKGEYLNECDYQLIEDYTKGTGVQVAGYSDFDLYSFSKVINPALIHDSKILSMPINETKIQDIVNPICRINIMGNKESIDYAISILPKEIFEKYYTVRNETFSFELLNKSSGKGNAIKFLMDYLGLNNEEVLVLGDNFNDIDMLIEAGQSVAMGQAHEDIKRICTYVTDTNEKNGFTKAIEKLVYENNI